MAPTVLRKIVRDVARTFARAPGRMWFTKRLNFHAENVSLLTLPPAVCVWVVAFMRIYASRLVRLIAVFAAGS